jgi:hypothetical protein
LDIHILFLYFQVDQRGKQNRTDREASKEVVQAKLTSIYGKSSLRTSNGSKSFFNLKNNNSEDCIVIGRPQSHGNHTKGPGVSSVFEVEGEGRAYGNTLPTKRAHVEITSPRVGYVKSPSIKEEVNPDVTGNGFVTARAKLV